MLIEGWVRRLVRKLEIHSARQPKSLHMEVVKQSLMGDIAIGSRDVD